MKRVCSLRLTPVFTLQHVSKPNAVYLKCKGVGLRETKLYRVVVGVPEPQ